MVWVPVATVVLETPFVYCILVLFRYNSTPFWRTSRCSRISQGEEGTVVHSNLSVFLTPLRISNSFFDPRRNLYIYVTYMTFNIDSFISVTTYLSVTIT